MQNHIEVLKYKHWIKGKKSEIIVVGVAANIVFEKSTWKLLLNLKKILHRIGRYTVPLSQPPCIFYFFHFARLNMLTNSRDFVSTCFAVKTCLHVNARRNQCAYPSQSRSAGWLFSMRKLALSWNEHSVSLWNDFVAKMLFSKTWKLFTHETTK